MQGYVTRALEDVYPAGLQYGCSKRAEIRSPALSCAAFYLQSAAFSKWAMLGSNQRPPPCKLGRGFPTTLSPVREFRLSERFTAL
jgi:hypothetical protein